MPSVPVPIHFATSTRVMRVVACRVPGAARAVCHLFHLSGNALGAQRQCPRHGIAQFLAPILNAGCSRRIVRLSRIVAAGFASRCALTPVLGPARLCGIARRVTGHPSSRRVVACNGLSTAFRVSDAFIFRCGSSRIVNAIHSISRRVVACNGLSTAFRVLDAPGFRCSSSRIVNAIRCIGLRVVA